VEIQKKHTELITMDALSEAVASVSLSIISSTSWCLLSASFCISEISGRALGPSIYEKYISMLSPKLTTDLKEVKALLQSSLTVLK
jgi:hypothetical protein